MTQPNEDDLCDRLRRALPVAMKAQDRPAVAARRSTLAAIDNAEAVDPDEAWPDDMDEDFYPAGWEAADTGAAVVDAARPGVRRNGRGGWFEGGETAQSQRG
jgi:hypothetical protein